MGMERAYIHAPQGGGLEGGGSLDPGEQVAVDADWTRTVSVVQFFFRERAALWWLLDTT